MNEVVVGCCGDTEDYEEKDRENDDCLFQIMHLISYNKKRDIDFSISL